MSMLGQMSGLRAVLTRETHLLERASPGEPVTGEGVLAGWGSFTCEEGKARVKKWRRLLLE